MKIHIQNYYKIVFTEKNIFLRSKGLRIGVGQVCEVKTSHMLAQTSITIRGPVHINYFKIPKNKNYSLKKTPE